MISVFEVFKLRFVQTIVLIASFVGSVQSCVLMDEESESLVTEIVDELKGALNFNGEIKVYISNDPALNACATQGGDIVINAGAIVQCENSKELIAILAHEVGHIAGNHIASYLSKQNDFLKAGLVPALIGVLASMYSQNGAPALAGLLGGQSIGTGMALSQLRKGENIADSKAMQCITKLRWWPVLDGALSLYKKLDSNSAVFSKYLSTHPRCKDRISKVKEFKNTHGGTPPQDVVDLLANFETRFQTVKMKMRALTVSLEVAKSLFKNFKTPNEKYARAIILYRLNKYQESSDLIDALLKEDPQNAYYTEIKAMNLINLKKCAKAADVSWAVLKGNKKIHRDLGIIYADAVSEGWLTAHSAQAIKTLKRILTKHEDDLSAINLLGRLYSLSGDDSRAALYAAKSDCIFKDAKMAKVHAQKALKSEDPIIRNQANDILNSLNESE